MSNSSPDIVKQIYVSQQELQNKKIQSAIEAFKVWIDGYNDFMNHLVACIAKKRFVFFSKMFGTIIRQDYFCQSSTKKYVHILI